MSTTDDPLWTLKYWLRKAPFPVSVRCITPGKPPTMIVVTDKAQRWNECARAIVSCGAQSVDALDEDGATLRSRDIAELYDEDDDIPQSPGRVQIQKLDTQTDIQNNMMLALTGNFGTLLHNLAQVLVLSNDKAVERHEKAYEKSFGYMTKHLDIQSSRLAAMERWWFQTQKERDESSRETAAAAQEVLANANAVAAQVEEQANVAAANKKEEGDGEILDLVKGVANHAVESFANNFVGKMMGDDEPAPSPPSPAANPPPPPPPPPKQASASKRAPPNGQA